MGRALAVTAVALAAFTGAVLAGAMNGIDDWGLDHVMPALDPYSEHGGLVAGSGLWRPFPLDASWWQKLLDAINYPASALVSATVVAVGCFVLLRRGKRWPALLWLGAWCSANALELLGKYFLTRPGVHWSSGDRRVHVLPYDSSYPSGHNTRAVVVAAVVAYVWPHLRRAAAGWLLLVPVTLVITAAHTISDVVGGMLLGLLLVLAAHAMIRGSTRSQTSSNGSNGRSWVSRSRFSPTSRATESSFQQPS